MSRVEALKRIRAKLKAELGGAILHALENDDIVEVVLNHTGEVWAEGHKSGFNKIGVLTRQQGESIIGTIASSLDSIVSKDTPIISGTLPTDGSRFEGLISPVVDNPVFAIRKRAIFVYTLDDYVEAGIASPDMVAHLKSAVLNKKNIIISGGTGSGKTTLANAIIKEMAVLTPDDRAIIIEDTAEIQCEQKNAAILRTSDTVTMQKLLRSAMRLRPDRIIVGEVRGGEALTLLKSWNTGHPGGVATVHSNSARSALTRLEQLISEVIPSPMQPLIAEAVDMIVSIQRTQTGRVIKEILLVEGWDDGAYALRSVTHEPIILKEVV